MWALTGKLSVAVLTMLTASFLARVLSPAEFGGYLLATTFTVFGSALSMLGLNTSVVRDVAKYTAVGDFRQAKSCAWLYMRIVFVSSATIAIICCLVGRYLPISLPASIYWLIAIWIVALAASQFVAEALRGYQDIRLASLFTGYSGGPIAVLVTLSIYVVAWSLDFQLTLHSALAILVSVAVASATASVLVLRYVVTKSIPVAAATCTAAAPSVGNSLHSSFPLLVTSLSALVKASIGLWIVSWFCSTDDIALFGAVLRLMAVITLPATVILAVIPPIISELNTRKEMQKLQVLMRSSATFAGVPSVFALLLLIAAGAQVLTFAFSGFYAAAAGMLAIVATGYATFICGGAPGMALMMTGRQNVVMWISALSLAFQIITGIWATQTYGAIGMAWAMAVTSVLTTLATVLAARLSLGVWTHIELNPKRILTGFEYLKSGLSRRNA